MEQRHNRRNEMVMLLYPLCSTRYQIFFAPHTASPHHRTVAFSVGVHAMLCFHCYPNLWFLYICTCTFTPQGTAGDRRGPQGTAGDRRGPQGTAGDCRGPQGTAGDRRFASPQPLRKTSEVYSRLCIKFAPKWYGCAVSFTT